MNTNLTREERIRNVAAGQMVEELKGRHAYLHGVNFGREEYGVFWLRSTDTTWGHGWGRLVGYDEMFKAHCGKDADDMFGTSRFAGWFGHELDGHDRRSTYWGASHVLASPVIEVADDGLSARSWYLTPGTMMNRFGRDGQHRSGGWLWERYGSDFVYSEGKWWWAHEQVCPDIAGSLDKENWARTMYELDHHRAHQKMKIMAPNGPTRKPSTENGVCGKQFSTQWIHPSPMPIWMMTTPIRWATTTLIPSCRRTEPMAAM